MFYFLVPFPFKRISSVENTVAYKTGTNATLTEVLIQYKQLCLFSPASLRQTPGYATEDCHCYQLSLSVVVPIILSSQLVTLNSATQQLLEDESGQESNPRTHNT